MVVIVPHGEVEKAFPVVRLAPPKLIVSVDAVIGVEILATTLAGNHMATVLPQIVLARHLQRLKSFVTDITGMNPLSLLCFVPPTGIPSSKKIIFLTNLPSTPEGPCSSTPLHVLLKADPRLEGDLQMTKLILPCAYNLTRYL